MNQLTNELKSKKLKVTPQRLSIYHKLCNTKKHPSAESIYNSIQEEFPTMSLATVYKTLDTLKKVGLVNELNVGEDSHRYDANITPHCHFQCRECDCVFDIDYDDEIISYREKVISKTGFSVDSQQLYFFGKCSNCTSK